MGKSGTSGLTKGVEVPLWHRPPLLLLLLRIIHRRPVRRMRVESASPDDPEPFIASVAYMANHAMYAPSGLTNLWSPSSLMTRQS
jgi:hypothetical protein